VTGSGEGPSEGRPLIDFARRPDTYRHWRLSIEGPVATLAMAVDPDGGLAPGYALKLNSYDLGVDIELYDAVQRLRFEHPEVHAVVITSGLDRVFCAGANISMLARATHQHKVNFCKFTNETRLGIEDASHRSGQTYLCAVNGTASGGGYELALACEEIILVDDRSSAVSLPEVALLGVLPGTGGLSRLTDKRLMRRDRADAFSTKAEGVRGEQAVAWGLVDAVAPKSRFDDVVAERAQAAAARSDRPAGGPGIELTPLERTVDADGVSYSHVAVTIDRQLRAATVAITGPQVPRPADVDGIVAAGVSFWPLALARELDDALLHLRFNEPEVATVMFRTRGDLDAVLSVDTLLAQHHDHWLVREIRLYLARVLRRIDLTSRTLVAAVDEGSCFGGVLAELVLAADQSFMLDIADGPELALDESSLGWFPMSNGLSRLATRFWGRPELLERAEAVTGKRLDAAGAADAGLVTFTPDDLDWDDEIRLFLEERASFSPDALTGLEANLRFAGPETMETKIFARLSAWQNWIFNRPNASGAEGALRRYGTGTRPDYDRTRV
jgi:benzoyl-CoA-dihydrodiol lyase